MIWETEDSILFKKIKKPLDLPDLLEREVRRQPPR